MLSQSPTLEKDLGSFPIICPNFSTWHIFGLTLAGMTGKLCHASAARVGVAAGVGVEAGVAEEMISRVGVDTAVGTGVAVEIGDEFPGTALCVIAIPKATWVWITLF